MRKIVSALCVASFGLLALNGGGQATRERTRVFRLDSMEGLETVNTKADIVVYRGRKALHLAPGQNHETDRNSMVALVGGTDFKDGIIGVEVAGVPIVAMDPTARGFVGVEFRAQEHGARAEDVDLDAGGWTKMRIEIAETKARLYVNGAEQPCLIVNDLKLGDVRGQIGLWAYIATDAYFSNLKVTQTN